MYAFSVAQTANTEDQTGNADLKQELHMQAVSPSTMSSACSLTFPPSAPSFGFNDVYSSSPA